MQIINLTPHEVAVYLPGRTDRPVVVYPPAKVPARVSVVARHSHYLSEAYGAPIRSVLTSTVQNLPEYDYRAEVAYIVSGAVLAAARSSRSTNDLLVPGPTVRDGRGRVIGCMGLYRSPINALPDPGAEDQEEVDVEDCSDG